MKALRVQVEGVVQGVGFRPHVYRLATSIGLTGVVKNSGKGVEILIEGHEKLLLKFVRRLRSRPPPLAVIERVVTQEARATGLRSFRVVSSRSTEIETLPPPDLAICPNCKAELLDPTDRRFGYPLINCTNCGPRFSIIRSLPYDRHRTTMSKFDLCRRCNSEYHDPSNRRFRAEPISCPTCGPRVWYVKDGKPLKTSDPIGEAAGDIDRGKIVAVKGIGGFHLAADATNEDAIRSLRNLKRRHLKPFAIMAKNLSWVEKVAYVTESERTWLSSRSSPIVLLRKRPSNPLAPSVAPNLDTFGMMLPYTGIHAMLLRRTSSPFLVMTSGNPKDEVIAHRDREAKRKLSDMTSSFLVHNREILNFEDDSVMRLADDRVMMIRRSRGFAPLPIPSPVDVDGIMGIGADLKNTFAIGKGNRVFISQHIGDLESARTLTMMAPAIRNLGKLIGASWRVIAHDMHPSYRSSELAQSVRATRMPIQHHHAHLVTSAASNGVAEEALGLACDGTGYGEDGQVWGFEMMAFTPTSYRRIGALLPFRLPGSDSAVLDPRRAALSLLICALGGDGAKVDVGLAPRELNVLVRMVETGFNSPMASSCGRLFDAVSAMIGVCRSTTYEGQPAIELESASSPAEEGSYPYELTSSGLITLDHRPMVRAIVEDVVAKTPKGVIAARFHNTLVKAMAEMIRTGAETQDSRRVAVGGGSFCNSILVKGLSDELKEDGYELVMPNLLPPNDGGISYGQVVIAGARCN